MAEGSVSQVMDEEDFGAFLAESKLCGYLYEPRCSAEELQSDELWRPGCVPTGKAVANARHVGVASENSEPSAFWDLQDFCHLRGMAFYTNSKGALFNI